ncbi:hypothetical protein GUJ93_ZPchr0013g37292 [Zizania palustris]|uniref:Uncharacterized protein n=1 Tax=Zizania palustris TaxID=103762 RepID=A0A8J5WV05_ZIZPA|nr:hypothetical protein GUJ93_ZPchr0013g37292 [Zizania palustris]
MYIFEYAPLFGWLLDIVPMPCKDFKPHPSLIGGGWYLLSIYHSPIVEPWLINLLLPINVSLGNNVVLYGNSGFLPVDCLREEASRSDEMGILTQGALGSSLLSPAAGAAGAAAAASMAGKPPPSLVPESSFPLLLSGSALVFTFTTPTASSPFLAASPLCSAAGRLDAVAMGGRQASPAAGSSAAMAGSNAPAAAASVYGAGATRSGAPAIVNLPPMASSGAPLPRRPDLAPAWPDPAPRRLQPSPGFPLRRGCGLAAPERVAGLLGRGYGLVRPVCRPSRRAAPLLAVGFPPLMAGLGAAATGPYLPTVPPPLAATPWAESSPVLATAGWPATTDVVAADAALVTALATAKTDAVAARERERAAALAWESARQAADALTQHVAEAKRYLGVAVPPTPITADPVVAADPGVA